MLNSLCGTLLIQGIRKLIRFGRLLSLGIPTYFKNNINSKEKRHLNVVQSKSMVKVKKKKKISPTQCLRALTRQARTR